MSMDDYVVLVDEHNNVLGIAPKLVTHNRNTPLHRGFSVFLFNSKGKLLLQKRGSKKKTWPLTWSNSCCGHPKLNESNLNAAKRRVKFELGIDPNNILEILPNFSYKAEMNGIVENELCPVLIAFTKSEPKPNKNDVEDFKWIDWQKFIEDIKRNPDTYSPWCRQEAKLLSNNKRFWELYGEYVK